MLLGGLATGGAAFTVAWTVRRALGSATFGPQALQVVGGMAAVHEYRLWTAHQAPVGKFVLATIFSAVFGWFAVSSFWRAARRSRSPRVAGTK